MGLELDPNEVDKSISAKGFGRGMPPAPPMPQVSAPKHNHYFKDVSHLNTVDVYRILKIFNVTDPCIQHAIKKLLVAGGRGAGKDINKDIQEAIDSLVRYQEIVKEDNVGS
jgi:hypothetical protein